ncbi:MAG: adenylyltransferase/cytidyltransferase family protein [Chitinophagales bacterium]|nr:adenylyltransferase/cytidyltransferase family protein [Chitinophagales bacterium]
MAEIIYQTALQHLREQYALQKIVFTNGCFDLLHEGHRYCFQEAKKLGDILVVGVNADDSIKRLKGAERPKESLDTRIQHLKEIKEIDFLISFEEDTPIKIILELCPNILVKGGDYTIETIIGAKEVLERGGEVVIIPQLPGYSTTKKISEL